MKITKDGIVNSLKILEEKLGKTNDLVVLKKIRTTRIYYLW